MLSDLLFSVTWIPQHLYLERFGEEKTTIDERIKRKHWIKGVHYNVPKGSKGRWINLEEVNKWASGQTNTKAYLHAN